MGIIIMLGAEHGLPAFTQVCGINLYYRTFKPDHGFAREYQLNSVIFRDHGEQVQHFIMIMRGKTLS